jgi:hypothetical protein
MASRFFECPKCHTLLEKSESLLELCWSDQLPTAEEAKRWGHPDSKPAIVFDAGANSMTCPQCRSSIGYDKIIPGEYDVWKSGKKQGSATTARYRCWRCGRQWRKNVEDLDLCEDANKNPKGSIIRVDPRHKGSLYNLQARYQCDICGARTKKGDIATGDYDIGEIAGPGDRPQAWIGVLVILGIAAMILYGCFAK